MEKLPGRLFPFRALQILQKPFFKCHIRIRKLKADNIFSLPVKAGIFNLSDKVSPLFLFIKTPVYYYLPDIPFP